MSNQSIVVVRRRQVDNAGRVIPSDFDVYAFIDPKAVVSVEVYEDTHSFCLRTTDRAYHGGIDGLKRVLSALDWDVSPDVKEVLEALEL